MERSNQRATARQATVIINSLRKPRRKHFRSSPVLMLRDNVEKQFWPGMLQASHEEIHPRF
jgi:hypothetical protein